MGRRIKRLQKNGMPWDKGGLNMRKGSRFAQKPAQRNAANARERSRMRTLSQAFSCLKTTLPWVPADTKLSKLDTLRSALRYIQHLNRILQEESGYPVPNESHQPVRPTWIVTTKDSRISEKYCTSPTSKNTTEILRSMSRQPDKKSPNYAAIKNNGNFDRHV